MKSKDVFLNYIGQLRIYSLIDLLLLLYVIKAKPDQWAGVLCLWIGFLAYLEWRHHHENRLVVPIWVSIILFLGGLILLKSIFCILFIFFAVIYSEKIKGYFAIVSPFIRGFQTMFLILAVQPVLTPFVILAGGIVMIRNICGDFRDTNKDSLHHVKTIPVLLGLKSDLKYLHLIALFVTSYVWWLFSGLPVAVLLLIFSMEALTYSLTPR